MRGAVVGPVGGDGAAVVPAATLTEVGLAAGVETAVASSEASAPHPASPTAAVREVRSERRIRLRSGVVVARYTAGKRESTKRLVLRDVDTSWTQYVTQYGRT